MCGLICSSGCSFQKCQAGTWFTSPHHFSVLTILQKSPKGQNGNGHSYPLEDIFYSKLRLWKETCRSYFLTGQTVHHLLAILQFCFMENIHTYLIIFLLCISALLRYNTSFFFQAQMLPLFVLYQRWSSHTNHHIGFDENLSSRRYYLVIL